eukprot:TRINITY_DN2202_c0_g1_i1.p1 TRINITY_DN2202_c0_g1~~TRINITY_DN2202_c0_g1_i1.p1  ORF type:complete len:168 (-),score=22.56 TRINITY_DN2202_c0_g1_i1:141-644(-)
MKVVYKVILLVIIIEVVIGVPKPSVFTGNNEGIGSWYACHEDGDCRSWCGFKYTSSTPMFAPDLSLMTNGTNAFWPNPLWTTFGEIYCGLETIVTDGNTGNQLTLYLGDAFDHRYVPTPGSIGIMEDSWIKLHNMNPGYNHSAVINPVKWHFTGRRSTKYCFKCSGD